MMAEENSSKKEIVLALIAAGQAIILGLIGVWSLTSKSDDNDSTPIAKFQSTGEQPPLVALSYVSLNNRNDKSKYLIEDCEKDSFESAQESDLEYVNRVELGIVSGTKNSIKIRYSCIIQHDLLAISAGYSDTLENRELGRKILTKIKSNMQRQLLLTREQRDARDAMAAVEIIESAEAASSAAAAMSDYSDANK